MRTLILGATGFAGSHITQRFLHEGHEVRALVRPERRDTEAFRALPKDVVVKDGAIGDPNQIAEAAEGCDVIVISVSLPEGSPDEAYRWLHIAGTENVIAAARDRNVPRVVLISCGEVVLADEERVHWNEKREVAGKPLGARAQALKLGEEIALSASDALVAVTALRPGWLWGPGDRGRAPKLIEEARKHGGIDLCGDGKNLVATTYVEHLAEATLLAARVPAAAGQAFYIGDPEFLEMGEFLGMFSKALGLPAPRATARWLKRAMSKLGQGELSAEEIVRRARGTHFDTEKAAQVLGFAPQIPIDEGMKRMKAWFEHEERPLRGAAGAAP